MTFTLQGASSNGSLRTFGQGLDTGFGGHDNVTYSVVNVSGTTTDLGQTIVFDGFSGIGIATFEFSGNSLGNRAVEIDGVFTALDFIGSGSGGVVQSDFALTSSVLVNKVAVQNGQGEAGTIVGRTYDLQFSTVPEPSSYALLAGALALGAVMIRRRK